MDNKGKAEFFQLPTTANEAYTTSDGRVFNIKGTANPKGALSVNAFYSGVRFLSETLATLPKDLYRKVGSSRNTADNHYIVPLVTEYPNQLYNAIYLWETCISHAAMYGNGYIWAERNKSTSKVIGLYNVHACLVKPFQVGGKRYYALRRDGQEPLILPYSDVMHLRNLSEDGEEGVNVIDKLALTLGIPAMFDQFLYKYFEEGALVNLVLETEGQQLTRQDIDDMKYGIKRQHGGIENAHNVLIAVNSKAKNLTSPLQEFALDILKQSTVHDIARALRLPPHILYDLSKSNYNSLEWLGTELVKYSFTPYVSKIELEAKRVLLTDQERQQGYYFKFNLDGLQRGDYKTRRDTLRADYLNGLISWEEWREAEDMSIERQGMFVQPLNIGSDPSQQAPSAPQGGQTAPAEAPIDPQSEPIADPKEAQMAKAEAPKGLENLFGRFIKDACERVNRKQKKAFEAHFGKENYADWASKFADEQGSYLCEALNPFLETAIEDAGELAVVCQMVCEDYAAEVRSKNADADPMTVVGKVITRIEHGKN